MDRGAWWATAHKVAESDTTEWRSMQEKQRHVMTEFHQERILTSVHLSHCLSAWAPHGRFTWPQRWERAGTGKPGGPFLPRSPLSQFREHLSPASLIPQSGSGCWSGRGLRWWHSGTHVWHSQVHCAIGTFRDVIINRTESAHCS